MKKLAILLPVFLLIGLLASRFQSLFTTPKPLQLPLPTPTPKYAQLFTSPDKSFTFLFAPTWKYTTQAETASASATIFTACDQDTLALSIIPNLDPATSKPLSARDYLQLSSNPDYSEVDGLRALLISDSATDSATPYSHLVIEATPAGQLLDFYYVPSCGLDLSQGQTYEFFPLIKSLKFTY